MLDLFGEKHNIRLTTPEMGNLWKVYIQNSATLCVVKHFAQHIQDTEIKPLVDKQQDLLVKYLNEITKIFETENFPIPKAFSDEDIEKDAPALYTDLYTLSFIYRFNQMAVSDYATILPKVARTDIVKFFDESLKSSTKLYLDALNLMLSKGIYDRPPKIAYPDKVQFIEKETSLLDAFLGEHTPLNALELGEIFYTIERNYIGIILLTGLIQVIRDKEIKDFLIEGKELAQKQIDIFNDILKKEGHLGTIPLSLEITNSTISPFSDRLIMFLIATTITTGVYLSAYALSLSLRKDLVAKYSLLIAEIMKYGGDGLKIMIQRGWMEQPPQAIETRAT